MAKITVVTLPQPEPPKKIMIELNEEEATELATIFYYIVGGHWVLRDNMPGSTHLRQQLVDAGFRPRQDWGDTRLVGGFRSPDTEYKAF